VITLSEYLAYLVNNPLFCSLSEEQLKEVDHLIVERIYKKGRIIFIEGEEGKAVYLLRSGRVKISTQADDGREQILHFIYPGEVFGEVVIYDGGPYPATAEVVEDSKIGMIRNSDMDRLTLSNPEIALAMLRIMSKRLRNAQRQINELALYDTFRRMVSMLMFLAAEQGVHCDRGTIIDMSLTNQDLANMIGTSRETANRILSELRKQKAIILEKKQIIIADMGRLKSWL
jgi:CRP/FNR family cyclic AMP-dependent transcriptional regulator